MWVVTISYDEKDGVSALPMIECAAMTDDTVLTSAAPLSYVYSFNDRAAAVTFMDHVAQGITLHHAYLRHANALSSRQSRQRERERIDQLKAERAAPRVIEFTLLDDLRALSEETYLPLRVINPIIRRCKIYSIREDQLHSTQEFLERYNEESRAFMARYPTLAVFIEALKVYPLHTFGIKNFGEKCRSYLLDAIENR